MHAVRPLDVSDRFSRARQKGISWGFQCSVLPLARPLPVIGLELRGLSDERQGPVAFWLWELVYGQVGAVPLSVNNIGRAGERCICFGVSRLG